MSVLKDPLAILGMVVALGCAMILITGLVNPNALDAIARTF